MEIQATILKKEVYELKLNGHDRGLFIVTSEWNGLLELASLDDNSQKVIVHKGEDGIMEKIFAPTQTVATIVTISPSLIPLSNDKQTEKGGD